jgi:hypothetical protein
VGERGGRAVDWASIADALLASSNNEENEGWKSSVVDASNGLVGVMCKCILAFLLEAFGAYMDFLELEMFFLVSINLLEYS